jgi:hypothetical protein
MSLLKVGWRHSLRAMAECSDAGWHFMAVAVAIDPAIQAPAGLSIIQSSSLDATTITGGPTGLDEQVYPAGSIRGIQDCSTCPKCVCILSSARRLPLQLSARSPQTTTSAAISRGSGTSTEQLTDLYPTWRGSWFPGIGGSLWFNRLPIMKPSHQTSHARY